MLYLTKPGVRTMPKATYFVTCPRCGEEFDERLKACPHCKTKNRKAVCRTCGAQISASVKRCPSCGAKHRKKLSLTGKILVAVFGVLFIFMCVGMASQDTSTQGADGKSPELTREEYIAQCEDLSYSGISRNPDEYKGRKAVISGTVVQVQEGLLDSVTLRVQTEYGIWYVTYTRPEGESRILENDRITCYGECRGVQTYTALLGNQVTIPSMQMKYHD